MSVSQRNGVISPLNGMGRGYMHDHGYALLFLACVYGEEDDVNLRRKLEGGPTGPRLILSVPGVGYRFRSSD